ncbi:hypothetical protein, partial [Gilvimarinus sp. 1_MG-2023]
METNRITPLLSALLLAFAAANLTACGGSASGDSTSDDSSSSDVSDSDSDSDSDSVWLLNETGAVSAHILSSETGLGVEV